MSIEGDDPALEAAINQVAELAIEKATPFILRGDNEGALEILRGYADTIDLARPDKMIAPEDKSGEKPLAVGLI